MWKNMLEGRYLLLFVDSWVGCWNGSWFWRACNAFFVFFCIYSCCRMHGPWIGFNLELLHSAVVQYPCVDAAVFLSRCCALSLSLSLCIVVAWSVVS